MMHAHIMSKSKNGKRQLRQKASSKQSHPRRQIEIQISPRRDFFPKIWRRLIDILGPVAIILAVYGAGYEAWREVWPEPDMHVQTAQGNRPFLLHFSLRNPSFLVSMDEMQIACDLKRVNFEKGAIAGIELANFAPQISLQPRQTVQYNCPVERIGWFTESQVTTARIFIATKFQTFGIQRKAHSDTFNWDGASHQWIEGETIN